MEVLVSDILGALERQAQRDNSVFFAEVRNGPTVAAIPGELCIMDAVSIARSWSKPYITGYEIKITRHDFIRDDKWPRYKQYCNFLYFVCPQGLIKKDEVSEDVGLKYYNPETKIIRTVKKALFREIEFPRDMIWYLLICRKEGDTHPFYSTKAEMWRDWLEKGAETHKLGREIGYQIAKKIQELRLRIMELEGGDGEIKMRRMMERYEIIKRVLYDAGFEVEAWKYRHDPKVFEKDLREFINFSGAIGATKAADMQNLKRRLDEISDELLKAKYILDGITRDTQ